MIFDSNGSVAAIISSEMFSSYGLELHKNF